MKKHTTHVMPPGPARPMTARVAAAFSSLATLAPLALAALLVSILLCFVSCGGDNNPSVPVSAVVLRQRALSMATGEVRRLEADVEPPNATNKNLTWVSNNPLVAVVSSDGTVTAVSAGASAIVATSVDGGKMDICNLTVGPSVARIVVEPVALSLTLSGTDTLVARIEPADAVNKKVTWTSYNSAVASAEPTDDDLVCHVRARSVGRTVIMAIAQDGAKTAQCDVTVEAGTVVGVTGVALNKASTTIGVGSSETLYATVQPEDATIRSLTWSSSDARVAVVSANGVVTAAGPGRAVVTARAVDGGHAADCDVTVASVYAAGFEFSPSISISRLWKDGEPQNLSDGSSTARANSVYVLGNVVYAAGHENNEEIKPVARLWVNGSPQNLGSGVNPSAANSVFVLDSNVYVAGVEEEGNVSTAKLWIGGNPMNLSSGARGAEARSVFAADAFYYVAGFEMDAQGRAVARLWTNDPRQRQYLSDGARDAQATSVHVSGDNVYVAGFEKNDTGKTVAKLWINGDPLSLTDGRSNAKANAVFVAENNTYYAVGYEYNEETKSVAKLWTNDAAQAQNQDLSNGTANAEALSVFALGSGVYAVGSENNSYGRPTGRLWLNGSPQPLGNGTDNSAAASVFLR